MFSVKATDLGVEGVGYLLTGTRNPLLDINYALQHTWAALETSHVAYAHDDRVLSFRGPRWAPCLVVAGGRVCRGESFHEEHDFRLSVGLTVSVND